MPKISTYKTVIPQGDDKIIISQQDGTPSNVTKNITVDGLKNYIGAEGIPTPYMYSLKRPQLNPIYSSAFIAMQKPIETEWLSKNPRLFMFRYKKTKARYTEDGEYIMKKNDFVHPSHNNGEYQRANFPGSNWASTKQDALYEGNYIGELFPITTEWDINTELKIAKTESLITDFASLRPTTYIEVPFNPLQFLYDNTNTEVTSLPAVTSGNRWGTRLTVSPPNSNVNIDNNPDNRRTSKIIMKFAIGIPNPTWTNTNHELPYIFGKFSNAMMLKYQYPSNSNPAVISNYTITQGANGNAARRY